jgi:hypothetical protein
VVQSYTYDNMGELTAQAGSGAAAETPKPEGLSGS